MDDSCPELPEYLGLYAAKIRCVHCNDSTVIDTVAKFCRDLTSLKVYHTIVTDSVNVLLRTNQNLQEVHIICVEEDEAHYSIHNQNLSQLKLLSLYSSSSNDAKLINLVNGASSLLQLDLTFCEEITDHGAMAVIKNCPQLRSFGAGGVQLSADILVSLSKSCPYLIHVNLAGNAMLTDDAILSITKNLTALRSINLSCTEVTYTSIQCITENCASTLQIFSMDGIPEVRIKTLQLLLQKCTQLIELTVDCNFNDCIDEIVPYMRNLTTLVTYAVISDGALCMIAKHCKQLKRLAIMSTQVVFQSYGCMAERSMDRANEDADWDDRRYTPNGFIALMDGLVNLQLLGVRAEELKETGILNKFTQTMWQRLRPRLVFTDIYHLFQYEVTQHSIN